MNRYGAVCRHFTLTTTFALAERDLNFRHVTKADAITPNRFVVDISISVTDLCGQPGREIEHPTLAVDDMLCMRIIGMQHYSDTSLAAIPALWTEAFCCVRRQTIAQTQESQGTVRLYAATPAAAFRQLQTVCRTWGREWHFESE